MQGNEGVPTIDSLHSIFFEQPSLYCILCLYLFFILFIYCTFRHSTLNKIKLIIFNS